MPVLKNQVHEQFCQLVASGKGKKEAFLAARDPKKPPLISDESVRSSAANLMCRADVKARIAELTERLFEAKIKVAATLAEKEVLTRSWVIDQLIDNVNRAKAGKRISDANVALHLLGKEIGMFVTVTKATVTHVNADDLSDGELADIAATSRLDTLEAPSDPSKFN